MTTSGDWLAWTDPGWSLTFRYPPTDGAGRPVTVDRRESQPGVPRVHVIADDQDEIYFEVVRASGMKAAEFHRSMQERLPARYPDVTFAPLTRAGVWRCGSFRWADQVRTVCFVEHGDVVYRVIYRPNSPTNLEIWGTLEVAE